MSHSYCVYFPSSTPLLLTHQAQSYRYRLLAIFPSLSLFLPHANGYNSSNLLCLVSVISVTSGPSTSATPYYAQRKKNKQIKINQHTSTLSSNAWLFLQLRHLRLPPISHSLIVLAVLLRSSYRAQCQDFSHPFSSSTPTRSSKCKSSISCP